MIDRCYGLVTGRSKVRGWAALGLRANDGDINSSWKYVGRKRMKIYGRRENNRLFFLVNPHPNTLKMRKS